MHPSEANRAGRLSKSGSRDLEVHVRLDAVRVSEVAVENDVPNPARFKQGAEVENIFVVPPTHP